MTQNLISPPQSLFLYSNQHHVLLHYRLCCLRLVFLVGRKEELTVGWFGTGSGSRLTYGPAARRPARPSSSSFSSCPPHFSFRAFSRPRGLCGAGTVSDGRGGGSGPRFRFRHVATGFVRPSRALGNLRRQGRSADDEGPRDGEIRVRATSRDLGPALAFVSGLRVAAGCRVDLSSAAVQSLAQALKGNRIIDEFVV